MKEKNQVLAKLYVKNMSGEISKDGQPYTSKELASMVGMSEMPKTQNFNELLCTELKKVGVTETLIAGKVKELLENEDPNAIDKGLKHILKITGGYAPEKKQIDERVEHKFTTDDGDYLMYLLEKNKKREVIDFEEIE